ncbi:CYFA0S13e00694g1_1 [Cyberlindnera fabianii]|uniref:CYFA0S13e00694g1_1 n=1 Tax=Cyberlindnera fabianii TaxID=36022 RepID=A0A061B277_CYBFA|nr:CYFA0S13e00694g1_1 [Cyberlindnera fabianii]
MPYGVLPLSVICENVLLRNHTALRDLGGTRFQLIRRVLFKCTPSQLTSLEEMNPLLVLEDEDVWYHILKRDFPTQVHERYTTNRSKIKLFYKQQLDKIKYDYKNLNFDNYIKYEEVRPGNKFKLPSKLVYLKYKEEQIRKEESVVENLRQRMKDMQAKREKNKVVQLDEIIPVSRVRGYTPKPECSTRSKLFQKAHEETKRRRDFFKNPLSLMPPSPPKNRTLPVARPVAIPAKLNMKPTSTPPVTSITKPSSPARKVASIFHAPRRPPKRTFTEASTESANAVARQSNSTTPSSTRPMTPQSRSSPSQTMEQERRVKKIKLGDYIARRP